MRYDLFLQPFLVALAVGIGLCLVFVLVPLFERKHWRQGVRHGGKGNISRLGGVALFFGFCAAIAFDEHLVLNRPILGLLIGSMLVTAVGLWDDFRELSFKAQGFFQVAITVFIFIFGIRITSIKNPFGDALFIPEQGVLPILFGFVVLLIWMCLVLNAVNWLDGLDGLLGSVSVITLLTIFFLSLKPEVNQPPIALMAIIGVGAVLGFLLFNIHPARILAGTSGSMFLGFLIATLSVIAGTKIATAVLVLALPIADALWVIFERFRDKASIFQSDQRHLHYRLRALGWSESQIAWFFSLFTGVIAFVAFFTESVGKFMALVLITICIFSFLWFVAHRTRQQST